MRNLLLISLFISGFAFANTVYASMQPDDQISDRQVSENPRNIIYIDISISQPNVEECFATSMQDEFTDDQMMHIFPNPNSGIFTLDLNLNRGERMLNIMVYDISGKLVYQSEKPARNKNFNSELDLSFLKKGVYFIRVSTSGQSYVNQFIIK
ncbi:MAG: T9SS C-terminal target domain-containing protein [Bacteroidetes bacterium]|nr:MAG: T9SS C-terminal target domain-containing protein [Bacteroidota bacterium]